MREQRRFDNGGTIQLYNSRHEFIAHYNYPSRHERKNKINQWRALYQLDKKLYYFHIIPNTN